MIQIVRPNMEKPTFYSTAKPSPLGRLDQTRSVSLDGRGLQGRRVPSKRSAIVQLHGLHLT